MKHLNETNGWRPEMRWLGLLGKDQDEMHRYKTETLSTLCLMRHQYTSRGQCPLKIHLCIPLLKNKHGDASSVDTYRGITLWSVVSKLFESVILALFLSDLQSDALQFGFKKDCGCVHALFTFRESIQYFTSKGSRVFCVSLDAYFKVYIVFRWHSFCVYCFVCAA